MKIFLTPVSPPVFKGKIEYSFSGDTIIASYGKKTDTFDFTNLPDGRLETEKVITKLAMNPVLSAERENGVLSVVLLNYIGPDASVSERFPEWMEVGTDGRNDLEATSQD